MASSKELKELRERINERDYNRIKDDIQACYLRLKGKVGEKVVYNDWRGTLFDEVEVLFPKDIKKEDLMVVERKCPTLDYSIRKDYRAGGNLVLTVSGGEK